MKKKIFVSLATVTLLMSSGFATTSAYADSESQTPQSSAVEGLNITSNPLTQDNESKAVTMSNLELTAKPYENIFKIKYSARGSANALWGTLSVNNKKIGLWKVTIAENQEDIAEVDYIFQPGDVVRMDFEYTLDGGSSHDCGSVETVVEGSSTEIVAPTVNQPVYEGDTVVHGRGSKAGDSIYITNDKGTMIGSGVVNSDLSFAVTILPQPAYTTLHVVESDGTHTSTATDVVVQESSGSEITAPTVNQPVYEGDTLITGRGSKIGNEIVVTNAAGAVIGAGTVGLNLEFTVAILPQAAYEKIFVVETDGTSTSAATEVIVHEAHEKLT